jgi:hypothetical protein
MTFVTKEALVLTVSKGGVGRKEYRERPRFVFYIDTDSEKLAFIDWFLTKLQVTDLFRNAMIFDGFIANFPDGSSALYFECCCPYEDYKEAERVFPLGSDANKLALFDLIVAGELDTIFGVCGSSGLYFKRVKAMVAMDAEKAAETLEAVLPADLANQIATIASTD